MTWWHHAQWVYLLGSCPTWRANHFGAQDQFLQYPKRDGWALVAQWFKRGLIKVLWEVCLCICSALLWQFPFTVFTRLLGVKRLILIFRTGVRSVIIVCRRRIRVHISITRRCRGQSFCTMATFLLLVLVPWFHFWTCPRFTGRQSVLSFTPSWGVISTVRMIFFGAVAPNQSSQILHLVKYRFSHDSSFSLTHGDCLSPYDQWSG